MNSIAFYAGTGDQARWHKQAGFHHSALVEIEPHYSAKLQRDARHVCAAGDMALVG